MYTIINGVKSNTRQINFGVPQGSVLGPLLFTLYINDIMYCIPKKHSRLFADGTGIFESGPGLAQTINNAQNLINKLKEWFYVNKLTINVPKCDWMVFHGKRKKLPLNIPALYLGQEEIPRVYLFRYIGLTLDPSLSWKNQINNICTRLNSFFGIFRYLRNKIPPAIKRQVYLSTASPILNYGIELYALSSSKLMNRLQSKQNQLLKVLYNKDWFYDSNLLHKECKLIKIKDLHELRVLTFVRKCLNKETIPLFHDYFSYKHTTHSHNTRNNLDLATLRSRTDYGGTRIKSIGARYWNSNKFAHNYLSFTIDAFKHNLKSNYIEKY